MISQEEKRLVEALRLRDRTALQQIFERYHAGLCRISHRIVDDRDEAKDIVQDVFIKLWVNSPRLQIEISLEAYLKRAVVNTSLNRLERKTRLRPLDLADYGIMQRGEDSVDQQQAHNELSTQIDLAVQKLPSRTRAVFVLIRYENMSYKEVAEQLHISLKAVEKEMMQALRLLRLALREFLPALLAAALFS